MMMRQQVGVTALVLVTCCVSSLFAQARRGRVRAVLGGPAPSSAAAEPAAATPGNTDQKKVSPLFYFRDNSKLAGQPDIDSIAVKTAYGVLKVPTKDLIRIRFAERTDEELRARIEGWIEKLGSEDFDTREEATEKLAEIGAKALPFLRQASKSKNEEIQSRSQELITEIYAEEEEQGEVEEDSVKKVYGREDEVVSARMTIRGTVVQDSFRVRSPYGTLDVATSKLSGIVFSVAGPANKKIAVAASYQLPGKWLDTKFEVEKGQKVRMSASGQISVSNYGVSCGPDGTNNYRNNRSFHGFPTLSLVGRIGKSGKPFLIGSSYKGTAKSTGRLYVGVVSFIWNPGGASGNYDLKVTVEGH